MKKLFKVLMVLVLAGFLLSACSTSGETSVDETQTSDALGRQVSIPEDPQRILALTSSAMQTIYNLGLEPVGKVEEYKISEAGMALPSVGQSESINMEAVYDLQPDLIIASSRYHADLEEELEASGATVYYFDPDAVGEIAVVDINTYFGQLLNRETEAQAYVDGVMSHAETLSEEIAATGIETGIMLKMGDTVMAAQNASSYGSMFLLLGIENVVPDDLPNTGKSSFVAFDAEAIAAADPDVIYLVAQSNDQAATQAMKADFLADEKWTMLSAVQQKNVVVLPFKANLNRVTVDDMLDLTASALLENKQ